MSNFISDTHTWGLIQHHASCCSRSSDFVWSYSYRTGRLFFNLRFEIPNILKPNSATQNTLLPHKMFSLNIIKTSLAQQAQKDFCQCVCLIFVHKTHTYSLTQSTMQRFLPSFFPWHPVWRWAHVFGACLPPSTLSVLVSLLSRSCTSCKWAAYCKKTIWPLFALRRTYCIKTALVSENRDQPYKSSWFCY